MRTLLRPLARWLGDKADRFEIWCAPRHSIRGRHVTVWFDDGHVREMSKQAADVVAAAEREAHVRNSIRRGW